MSWTDANRSDGQSRVAVEQEIKEPERYRVLLHNDDYTSMDFVVSVLRNIFHKTPEEATAIMLLVHHQGVGQCGVFTQEVAETKVHRVRTTARAAGYPLKCTMEKVH